MDDKKFDLIPQDEFAQNHSVNSVRPGLDLVPTGEAYAGVNPTPLQGGGSNKSGLYGLAEKHPDLINALGSVAKSKPVAASANFINQTVKDLRLPEISGGFLQGSYDTAKSAADLLPGVNVPSMNLKQYARQDPVSQIAFEGGKIVPEAAAWTEGYGALSKIPKLGSNSLLATGARGALTGFALGEDAPGGREGGAAIGAIGAPFYELQTKGIADKIVARKNEMQQKYKGLYDEFFGSLKNKGLEKIGGVKPESFDIESMAKSPGFSQKYISPLKKYMEEPTFENAHKAQSDLGKLQKEASKVSRLRPLTSEENDALKSIVTAKKRIMGQSVTELGKKGQADAAHEYLKLGEGYKKEVVPYFDRSIKDYERGDVTSSYLVRNLPNRAKFERTAQMNHQDLARYGKFKNIANNVTTGVGYGLMNNLLSRIGLKQSSDEYIGAEDNQ